jgi:hypothetical protein
VSVVHKMLPTSGKKVKCIFVKALRLCTDSTAHRRSRSIVLLFHDHGTRSGWGVCVTPRPFFTPGKDPVPIVQEAGWAPGPVWTGAKNLAPAGIWSPDRPARSQSLYRLSYPAPNFRYLLLNVPFQFNLKKINFQNMFICNFFLCFDVKNSLVKFFPAF